MPDSKANKEMVYSYPIFCKCSRIIPCVSDSNTDKDLGTVEVCFNSLTSLFRNCNCTKNTLLILDFELRANFSLRIVNCLPSSHRVHLSAVENDKVVISIPKSSIFARVFATNSSLTFSRQY